MGATDRLHIELQRMAIGYEWRPGERINELELSRQLKVSRSPLREALNRLVAEGFLVSKPNQGFFCRPFDPDELFNLYDFRCVVETQIVKLVAERAPERILYDLVEMAKKEVIKDKVLMLQEDEAFHLALAQATGNNEFVKALTSINNKIHFARWIDLRSQEYSKNEHVVIAQAIENRNGSLAESLMRAHIQKRYTQIVEITRLGFGEIYLRTKAT